MHGQYSIPQGARPQPTRDVAERIYDAEMVRRDDMKTLGEVTLPSVTAKDPLDHSEVVSQLFSVPPPKPDGAGTDPSAPNVRVVGSTVIARVPNFALKTPKPADRVPDPPAPDR